MNNGKAAKLILFIATRESIHFALLIHMKFTVHPSFSKCSVTQTEVTTVLEYFVRVSSIRVSK